MRRPWSISLGVITLWHPVYRFEGWIKAGTALASIGTAVVLYPIIPKALRLRTPEDLEALNRELERKNAEVEASRESFRNIVERNTEGILVLTEGNVIVFANPAACEYLDCTHGSLIGRAFGHPAEPDRTAEFEVETPEGKVKSAETWVSATQWEGRPALLVHIRDITTRKMAEHALRESQEQLQESRKMDAIGRMAGGIAHDFNNLLTAINGFSALALSKAPEDSPIREELVEVAKAGERAASLTRQLLAFSRKQVLSPQFVDLNRVVEDIAAMIRRIIGEDVDLVTRLEAGLPDIRIDPGQLEQIILNLAVNARDAMPAGGELAIETRSESFPTGMIGGTEPLPPGRYVLLSVNDKGVGMPPEVRERLFEPFFTTKEPGKGTGLGLSTVYGIVKQSEGQILVFSEPGKGSTFKLYFPAAADQAGRDRESAPGPLEKGAWSPSRAGSETILLVEDEAPVRKLVAELLEGAGYSVLPADDGVAALEAARAFHGPIHLLVTDVVMRNMGGQLLSRKLLEARPDTRILFMSGYTDESFLQMQVRNASISFIQKPFSPSQLLAKVRQALDTPVS